MATKDQEFTVGKGPSDVERKVPLPGPCSFGNSRDQALALAQRILRAYELARPEDTYLDEILLYGDLELLDDE
ncbi:hypothetical protein [Pseudomonas aeruginosa]|uniref:hypothetical protein n=1 Tax=Pseudomonas aeruginosa TaxID=287 RepID=UPI002113701A|nr:hypothetical protein [Pseudomonas aeruginosa]MCT9633886.1 hypothetical protein [Pseudomonas aeruginosa]